jgi:hypothetical protein
LNPCINAFGVHLAYPSIVLSFLDVRDCNCGKNDAARRPISAATRELNTSTQLNRCFRPTATGINAVPVGGAMLSRSTSRGRSGPPALQAMQARSQLRQYNL